jgi:hypothetical protein
MIHFLRVGEYESREAFRFLGEFRKSKLNIVELKPEPYIIMMRALLSHDNLGYITVKEIKLDEMYPNVQMVIDHQTSHCWVINPSPTRLAAQMHR